MPSLGKEFDRRQVLKFIGGGCATLIAARLVQLQVLEAKALSEEGASAYTKVIEKLAQRGQIKDRKGQILAGSTITYDVGVNQIKLGSYVHTSPFKNADGSTTYKVVGYGPAEAAKQLAPILQMDRHELGGQLIGDSTYKILAKDITPDEWRSIKVLGIPGVEPDSHVRRTYPSGAVAGNILGYVIEQAFYTFQDESGKMVEVNQDDLTEAQASAINSGTLYATRELRNVGQAGLELSRNKILTGTRGLERVEISINSDVLPNGVIEDKPARRGQNITTTIDRDLQMLAQKALDEQVKKMGARWGSVIVMDPASGDVLVLADSNSVDPSQPSKTPEANRRSRTVEAVFDPGSVGKVVTFAAALDQGKITPERSWVVPDAWTSSNGQSFSDSHEHETKSYTATQILAESSNIGTIFVGDTISDEVRYNYMRKFGWGSLTGIEMPSESAGLMSSYTKWDGRQRYTTMFGQGVSTTALQAVSTLATVANKGVRVPPRLIKEYTDYTGKVTKPQAPTPTRVISEASAATLEKMLVAVTQKGGTAESAAINGYQVAGKTGTSEIIGGEASGGTVASFVGFLPAGLSKGKPAVAVSVVIYDPQAAIYGGDVAAPVFRQVATAAMHNLGLAPDPQLVENNPTSSPSQTPS